ncbi:MAG: peptidase MA family metallohydrolase, partial [Anaerolineae bacterium]|nr:peptidase MA family metallohydrolase [Anaerolineae bacterium]
AKNRRQLVSFVSIPCECGVEEAEYYATFADDIYDQLAAVFSTSPPIPVNLRLFPTEQSYFQVNPIAERIPGVVAHALNSREEIAIAIPRTRFLTEEELINNIRHEMTHLFASYLSDGNLTAGFQEGIAQYLEQPTENAAFDPSLLAQALEQDRLLTWAELDQSQEVYNDPQVAYPQSLSVAAFLIDRYGLEKFILFLRVSAQEPGYRSALEATYGQSADQLEAEWLAYLPEYIAGRWQINAIYAYDLSDMHRLVEQAAYSDAATRLNEVIGLLEATDQHETLAEAELLLAQARQGQAAGALADTARAALQAGDYPSAIEQGNLALAAYESLEYRERIPEIQTYIYRAELGQGALNQLAEGERLLDTFRFFEADRQIYQATELLQQLGNDSAAAQGEQLLIASSSRQRWLVYAIIGVALLILLFNTVQRIINRFLARPLDMEFTA